MKKFYKYVGLSMMTTLGYSLYVLADTFFIANGIGADGLTALNLALPLYNVIFGIGLLLSVGGATKYAILKAQNEIKLANHFFSYVVILGIILSIPFVLIGFFFSKEVLLLLGAKEHILEIAVPYLGTYMKFAPFFIFNYIFTTFIKNDDNPRLVSIAGVIGTAFNIIFDYIFIYPMKMGMFGAALATGIAPLLSIIICSFHFKKASFHFIHFKWSFYELKEMIVLGIPALFNELSTGLIILVFNFVILSISGNIGVASYGIISNLAIIVSSLYNGITTGHQPLISESYGKNDHLQIKKYLQYSLITSLMISTIVLIITIVFPDQVIHLFNNDNNQTLYAIAKTGLPIYFSGYFFSGINMIMISYFASIDSPKESFIISLLHSGLLIIPVVLLLSAYFQMKGVWLSYPVSEMMIMIISDILYQKGTT